MRGNIGKVLVTGSSSGIGLAVAERLLAEGLSVLGLSRTRGPVENDHFEHVGLDLADLSRLPHSLKELSRHHEDVEVIVLCAGRGAFGSLEEFSYEQIRELLELNFISQAYLVRAFLPGLKRRRRGHLVFIGSEAAHRGASHGSIYCASKFALRGFAQALRHEASGSGVRVAFVSPGMTQTAFYDSLSFSPGDAPENVVLPSDIAAAVWLVLSSRPETVFDEIRVSPLKRVVRRRRGRG